MSRDEVGSVSVQSTFSQGEVLHLSLTQREVTVKVFANPSIKPKVRKIKIGSAVVETVITHSYPQKKIQHLNWSETADLIRLQITDNKPWHHDCLEILPK